MIFFGLNQVRFKFGQKQISLSIFSKFSQIYQREVVSVQSSNTDSCENSRSFHSQIFKIFCTRLGPWSRCFDFIFEDKNLLIVKEHAYRKLGNCILSMFPLTYSYNWVDDKLRFEKLVVPRRVL